MLTVEPKLVRRFDRDERGEGIGYSSAATVMGSSRVDYAMEATYAALATKARQQGITPCEADLFRRMLFNCFVFNTDDHLRNHGFLRGAPGWRLSPAFDLTVHRRPRLVLQPATGISPAPDPVVAFAAHPAFGLDRGSALRIYGELADGMHGVRDVLDIHGGSRGDQDILGDRWARALSPPAASSLPVSGLVRPPDSPGATGPSGWQSWASRSTPPPTRLGGRAAASRSAAGTPATSTTRPECPRVRDAGATNPVLEFFKDGDPVPPPERARESDMTLGGPCPA